MNNIWIISDTHWGHKKILDFCPSTRRGSTVDEMDQLLIDQWNSQVSPNDTVYHLGDFSFLPADQTFLILSQLNGRIHLIKGNHDYWINKETSTLLESVSDYKVFKHLKHRFVLFHYPIAEFDRMHHGTIHLYGHVHGKDMGFNNRSMDVGIDARPDNTMALWHIDEIIEKMEQRPVQSHH